MPHGEVNSIQIKCACLWIECNSPLEKWNYFSCWNVRSTKIHSLSFSHSSRSLDFDFFLLRFSQIIWFYLIWLQNLKTFSDFISWIRLLLKSFFDLNDGIVSIVWCHLNWMELEKFNLNLWISNEKNLFLLWKNGRNLSVRKISMPVSLAITKPYMQTKKLIFSTRNQNFLRFFSCSIHSNFTNRKIGQVKMKN